METTHIHTHHPTLPRRGSSGVVLCVVYSLPRIREYKSKAKYTQMNKRQNLRTAFYLYDIGDQELLAMHKTKCFLRGDHATWALCVTILSRWEELKGCGK